MFSRDVVGVHGASEGTNVEHVDFDDGDDGKVDAGEDTGEDVKKIFL